MKLYYREFGTGSEHLIILHGLYGSSDNWMSLGKQFGDKYHVIIPDLRNHGQSPHSNTHSFPSMTEDILELMQETQIERANFLGHSMGGKLAMFFTSEYPEKVNRLIVADISPREYKATDGFSNTDFHANLMDKLASINLNSINDYADADIAMSRLIDDDRLRKFMLKNVRKTETGFEWKINLPVLRQNLENIMEGFHPEDFNDMKIHTPSLFLRGENSPYIPLVDFELIRHIFSDSEIITIPNSGHWLHAEQPKLVAKNLFYFLNSNEV